MEPSRDELTRLQDEVLRSIRAAVPSPEEHLAVAFSGEALFESRLYVRMTCSSNMKDAVIPVCVCVC